MIAWLIISVFIGVMMWSGYMFFITAPHWAVYMAICWNFLSWFKRWVWNNFLTSSSGYPDEI